jgi:erythromycin esterase
MAERRKNVKTFIAALVLLLFVPPAIAQRRHAVRPPAVTDVTPAGWLSNHAYRLTDMQPLRTVIGGSTVVGLGDATHGTHEFFEIKLQMIAFLVTEMHFTTVGMEGPFVDFNRLNDYILGGSGDPHVILLHRELGYWFWASEEIVALAEWMRSYNASRGDRPPVQIVGFDVTDEKGSADFAVAYLNSVDPASPTDNIESVRLNLIAHEAAFVASSSQRAFDAALQAATVASAATKMPGILAYFAWRDENMAANAVLWGERHGKTILWGHQEHIGKTINLQSAKPMGKWLEEHYGADYFAIGSSAGDGTFNVLDSTNRFVTIARFLPIEPDSYERDFRSAAIPTLLIPLRIELPDWLATAHHLRGGSSNFATDLPENLKQKLDAILYIDQTTRSNNFW